MNYIDVLKYLTSIEEIRANKLLLVLLQEKSLLERYDADMKWETLLQYYNRADSVGNNAITNLSEYSMDSKVNPGIDLRIRSVKLSSFRGIPQSPSSLYGLTFVKDGRACSAIIYGKNGTGKSSLYQAIEYLLSGIIGESELREYTKGIGKKDYHDFILHGDSQNNTHPYCEVDTESGCIRLENGYILNREFVEDIVADLCFFSDYDLYQTGKKKWIGYQKSSFHEFIAENLGFHAWVECQNLLANICEMKNESDIARENSLLSQIMDITSVIDDLSKQVSRSHNDSVGQEEKSASLKKKLIDESKTSVKDINLNYVELNRNVKLLQEITTSLDIASWDTVDNKYITFLETGIQLFDVQRGCPFCNRSSLSIDELKTYVEGRLFRYKQINKQFANLDQTITRINEILNKAKGSFIDTSQKLRMENVELMKWAEFDDLRNENNSMISSMETYLSEFGRYEIALDHSKINRDSLLGVYNTIRLDLAPSLSKLSDKWKKYFQQRQVYLVSYQTKVPHSSKMEVVIESFEAKIEQLNNELMNTTNEREQVQYRIIAFNNMIENAKKLRHKVEEELLKMIQTRLEPLREVLKNVMDNYLNDDNMELIITADLGKQSASSCVSVNLKSKTSNTIISPAKYFNTYRYKLFCFMVNVGLLIAYRKHYDINLPLIIDDAFHSSDFENMVRFEKTLNTVIKLVRDYFPNQEQQIIIFTHEIQIYKSAISALINAQQKYIPVRLLKHNESTNEGSIRNLGYLVPEALNQPIKIIDNI